MRHGTPPLVSARTVPEGTRAAGRYPRYPTYQTARTRVGPPEASATLGPAAMRVAPAGGTAARLARFSRPHYLGVVIARRPLVNVDHHQGGDQVLSRDPIGRPEVGAGDEVGRSIQVGARVLGDGPLPGVEAVLFHSVERLHARSLEAREDRETGSEGVGQVDHVGKAEAPGRLARCRLSRTDAVGKKERGRHRAEAPERVRRLAAAGDPSPGLTLRRPSAPAPAARPPRHRTQGSLPDWCRPVPAGR